MHPEIKEYRWVCFAKPSCHPEVPTEAYCLLQLHVVGDVERAGLKAMSLLKNQRARVITAFGIAPSQFNGPLNVEGSFLSLSSGREGSMTIPPPPRVRTGFRSIYELLVLLTRIMSFWSPRNFTRTDCRSQANLPDYRE